MVLFVAISTVLLALSLSIGTASGALYTSPSQLPIRKRYDYIIVGGGAGGGVLANRLTENPGHNILLIEAGSSDFENLNIRVPGLSSVLANSQFDWNFTSDGQPGLNGRSIPYPRGFVLGGSTCINYMAYTRGSRDDYDRWARVTGDHGWSWDSLQPYILKMEKLTPPVDHHDTTGEIDPSIHGHSGPVGVSLTGHLLPTDDRVLDTSAQLSREFPFNLDSNSGNTIGVGWVTSTIRDGERVTSAAAYIAPALRRPNLDVLVHTQVTKVIQTGTQSGSPVFRGVQFAQSSSSPIYVLNATKEVILSAGAIKTPHILMLSGIGTSSQLSPFGIKTVVNSPDVGQNLQDHPLVTSSFTVNSTNTFDGLTQNATFAAEQLEEWKNGRTGELVAGPSNQLGWFRLPENSPIFDSAPDPSAGPTSAHYEFIFTNGFVSFLEAPPSTGNFFTIFTNIVSPAARGNITLASRDPFDHPTISPNFLSTEIDIFTMREAIKAARIYMSTPAWDGWILEEFGAFAEARTDAEIEQYARNSCETVNHIVGTAAMGKTGSVGRGSGALNADLTVKGTVGLRVVDASAFPFIPAAHPQTAVYILAERAADLIKSAAGCLPPHHGHPHGC